MSRSTYQCSETNSVVLLCGVVLCLCYRGPPQDYYYYPHNVSRSTLSGIAAYRSSLTLDWIAAEDSRQRELASAFETQIPPVKVISTDCIAYARPSPGKIGRLMLELLKNLEGDDGSLIPELIKVLIRTKLLVETSILDTEPDLESLVKTPGMMMGEPHTTFPRIVEVIWMLVSDPSTTRKYGWCPVNKVNKYLMISKPVDIAKQMRTLDVVVARARFIIEEFIQNITPMNMYAQKNTRKVKTQGEATVRHAMKPRAHEKVPLKDNPTFIQNDISQRYHHQPDSSSLIPGEGLDEAQIVTNDCTNVHVKLLLSIPFMLIVH